MSSQPDPEIIEAFVDACTRRAFATMHAAAAETGPVPDEVQTLLLGGMALGASAAFEVLLDACMLTGSPDDLARYLSTR